MNWNITWWEVLDALFMGFVAKLALPFVLALLAAVVFHFIVFLIRLSFGAVPWLNDEPKKEAV